MAEDVIEVDYTKHPNPLCHGPMQYEATLPSVFKPERLLYSCSQCHGQAIYDLSTWLTRWSRLNAFYTPDPNDSIREDKEDVLSDTGSQSE